MFVARRIHTRAFKHDSRWPGWQAVIGIETHAQLKSKHKLFSEARTSDLGDTPNTHCVPFDAAFPGTLPRLNQACVDLALRAALALKCEVNPRSSFDRKHYFYSDLPSGYQITQHYAPFARNGMLLLDDCHVRITQMQLEQDTAKSTFVPRLGKSYIDLNRAGTGLIEIVTEPDMSSPEEAGQYVRALQSVLRTVGASDGNMEMGSLRCDVNVSVNRADMPAGSGTRCEVKNVNGVKFIMAAIRHEIARQKALLDSGVAVEQQTRGFDPNTFETYALRSKEDAQDYRYMPDPNLGVLRIGEDRLERLRATQPPLPWETRARLRDVYGLADREVNILMKLEEEHMGERIPAEGSIGAVAYLDRVCEHGQRDPKVIVNWMTQDLLGQLTAQHRTFADNPLSAEAFGQLIDLVQTGTITWTSGKHLLRHMLASPTIPPMELAGAQGFIVGGDAAAEGDELGQLCARALEAQSAEVVKYRAGKTNVINKILGWVMRESKGRADAKAAKEKLEELMR
ncbi:GatB/GatE catalytic domain-containing protein [Schizophyllum amplum]|uniref:Glutamyl-tRNA(Gln) amidotransferase subunit B, mitochondrial n=1 Tax=Schizophyllum amplum TaxID=97359 RepID=A0A550CSS7_9AGAR|nr:GatB/GatE catalytic domain-containing protein [Auriculariopsis ampla]